MNIQYLPEYKDGQYYNLGADRDKAQDGLDMINSFMPVLNMTLWEDSLTECPDGYYRIPRIPTCRLVDAIAKGFFTMIQVRAFVDTYVMSIDSAVTSLQEGVDDRISF
jgi:hypothetical protein